MGMRRLFFTFLSSTVLACGAQGGERAASSDSAICLFGHGDCDAPRVACSSDLGRRVMKEAWGADFGDSMTPKEHTYGGRNVQKGPFVDAASIFPAMADEIANAKYEIDLETYEWGGWTFVGRDAVLHDPIARRDPTEVILSGLVRLEERLKAEGATTPVRVFFAINGEVSKVETLRKQIDVLELDPQYVEIHTASRGGSHETAVHIDLAQGPAHSKVLIVDGYRTIITGANPQAQQTLGGSWHDVGYFVSGQAGIGLREAFDENWKASREVTTCDGGCKQEGARPIDHVTEVASPDLDADPELADACLPVFVATRKPVGLSGGLSTLNPLSTSSPQDHAWLALVKEAQSVVRIESPNLNAPAIKGAIKDAVRRGVNVRVILSMGFNSSAERSTLAGGSNEDSVHELVKELGCDKLEVRWFSADGSRPTWGNEVPGASHAKYMSIDGSMVMVGSGNQDLVSWGITYESNVVIDSPDVTASYDAAVFDADWDRAFDVQSWARGVLDGTASVPADLDALLGDRQRWLSDVSSCRP